MKIKKLLAAVLSLAMGVSMMTACGSSDNSSKAEKDSSATENTQKHTNDPMTVTTAKDLVAQMKVGWNLGNTMDATGGSGLDAETSWGNVETTKLMIDQVKDAGFRKLSITVSTTECSLSSTPTTRSGICLRKTVPIKMSSSSKPSGSRYATDSRAMTSTSFSRA